MSIGVNNIGTGPYQKTIQQAILEGATIFTGATNAQASAAAHAAGNVLLQGKNLAPAAMADAATGLLPPPIPGGAVMEKQVVVYPQVTPVKRADLGELLPGNPPGQLS